MQPPPTPPSTSTPPTLPDPSAEAKNFFAGDEPPESAPPPPPPPGAPLKTFHVDLPPGAIPAATERPRTDIEPDKRFDANPGHVRDQLVSSSLGHKVGQGVPEKYLEISEEEKMQFTLSLGFNSPRFQLTVEVNPKIKTGHGNTASKFVIRDRIGVEEEVINLATRRKVEQLGADGLATLGWISVMSMACQLESFDTHKFAIFTGDPDKAPEEQVDALIAAQEKMFRRMTTVQINMCFIAFFIFTRKKLALETGVVRDDFFEVPISVPSSAGVSMGS